MIAFFLASMALTAQVIVTRVIETFDDPAVQQWVVTGSIFSVTEYPKMKYINSWPSALFGKRPDESAELNSIGVHGKFRRSGYHFIDLMPATVDADGNFVSQPITLPGIIKYFDVWVWCSNYNYDLEVHFRDHMDMEYILPLGSLAHQGWIKLGAWIPAMIPQTVAYIPRYKNLKLVKIRLWTRPKAKVDDFYVYVDQISVITDLYQERFDGDDLADEIIIENLWVDGE